MDIYNNLYEANQARAKIWDPDEKLDLSFHLVEMLGEAGEAANVYKKILRAKLGLRGSVADDYDLLDELADTVICAYLVASKLGVNLGLYIPHKFNGTSIKYELPVMMQVEPEYDLVSGELPEDDDAADVMNKLAELCHQAGAEATDDHPIVINLGDLRTLLGIV